MCKSSLRSWMPEVTLDMSSDNAICNDPDSQAFAHPKSVIGRASSQEEP